MIYLIKTTEQYRCDSEKEAKELIERAKGNYAYTVTKQSSEIKTLKQKGEIVDEWYRVTLTKVFNEEKEPDSNISISYTTSASSHVYINNTEEEEDDLK